MRAATTSILTLIDAQVELLENINRRLEELRLWKIKYPAFEERIAELYRVGLGIGAYIRDMEVTKSKSKRLRELTARHNQFLLMYDTLWRSIQEDSIQRDNSNGMDAWSSNN
jgi:hypothetical protein